MLHIPSRSVFHRPLASAALCLLVACQSTKHPAGSVVQLDGRLFEATAEAPSGDHGVEQYLAQYLRGTALVDGCQRVQLDLKNNSEAPLAFAYRVEWLDRQGQVVVEREQVWTPLVLSAGQQVPLELLAPAPRAESWRLRAVSLDGDS